MRSWTALLLLLGAVALTLVMAVMYENFGGDGGDDAYITYVYAQNLARGEGFTFNSGAPQTLGTTTPLYTILLGLGARAGADVPRLSVIVGALAMACSMAMLVLFARDMGYAAAANATVLVWVTNPMMSASVAGMETPLYIALTLGALWTAARGQRGLALMLGALCALTRPDGLAALGAVVIYLAARRAWSWRAAAPAAVVLGAWIVAATVVFGSPIPNSGVVKMLHETAISGRFSLLSLQFITLLLPLTWLAGLPDSPAATLWPVIFLVLAVGLVVGLLFRLMRSSNAGRLLVLWMALYAAGYSALGVPDFPWYYAPLALVGLFAAFIGVQYVLSAVARLLRRRTEVIAGAALIIGATSMAIPVVLQAATHNPGRQDLVDPHRLAGEWLAANAPREATVVGFEVGQLKYFSQRHTIDLLGPTEPAARPFIERREYGWAVRDRPDYIFTTERHDWIVTAAIYGEPLFRTEYEPVARFPAQPGNDYLLFARRRT